MVCGISKWIFSCQINLASESTPKYNFLLTNPVEKRKKNKIGKNARTKMFVFRK